MRYVFSLFLLTITFQQTILAEEPARGRTEDGQAYRIDGEGNQIVDYIAELEVNVDTLQRQVYALENETKQKKDLVERLQSGQGCAPQIVEKIVERDVVKPQVVEKCVPQIVEKIVEKEVIKPQIIREVVAKEKDCSSQVSAVETSYQGELLEQQNTLSECREALNDQRQKAASFTTQNTSYNQTINELKTALNNKNDEISELKEKLATASEAAKVKQVAVVELREEQAPRASLSYQEPVQPQREKTALFVARERAVDSLRGKILTELNSLKILVENRDTIFSAFSKKNHTISFTPTAARTKDNRDLNTLQHELRTAETVNQLSFLSRDIREIRRKIEEDIAVVKRAE